MNEAIIEKLFLQYKQKGFLTKDEIFEELTFSNVSIVQTERICSELITKGVLICDIKPQNLSLDKSHIDYIKLYGKIVEKEPNLSFLIEYIRKIQPPQLHEVEKLYPQIRTGNTFARKQQNVIHFLAKIGENSCSEGL